MPHPRRKKARAPARNQLSPASRFIVLTRIGSSGFLQAVKHVQLGKTWSRFWIIVCFWTGSAAVLSGAHVCYVRDVYLSNHKYTTIRLILVAFRQWSGEFSR